MFYNLIYTSDRNSNCTNEELEKILVKSQKNNRTLDITGVLLYSNSKFIQYLEGKIKDVLDLYDKIKPDPRHSNVSLIGGGYIKERIFPNWQMGSKSEIGFDFHFPFQTSEEEKAHYYDVFNSTKLDNIGTISLIKKLFVKESSNEDGSLFFQPQKLETNTIELVDLADAVEEKVFARTQELENEQEEIIAQRDEIEAKNNQLSYLYNSLRESIEAAQDIQRAILPTDKKLKNYLQNYFIMNLPRDVVSGDFYWVSKIENKLVVVLGDCTGHGVPGAFMTLISITTLDKIINFKGIHNPGEILENLDTEIRILLDQTETGDDSGLDAAVLVIDSYNEQESKVSYSGAKIPLLLFNNATSGSSFEEKKSTRRSLGGRYKRFNNTRPFETHVFKLNKGSRCYFGSDGLGDQLNVDSKKLGKRNIFKILEHSTKLPLVKQKDALLNAFHEQVEGTVQRDDILWMGIQF